MTIFCTEFFSHKLEAFQPFDSKIIRDQDSADYSIVWDHALREYVQQFFYNYCNYDSFNSLLILALVFFKLKTPGMVKNW